MVLGHQIRLPHPLAPAAVSQADAFADFDISVENHWLEKWVGANRRFWIWLDRVETEFLADRLRTLRIDRPVYVSGLARSGSTILLEILASMPHVATHRYRDCPPFFVPYFWNRIVDRIPRRSVAAVERTHRDGIMVTPESPEAMEEVLWMAFFPDAHDPARCNVLGPDTSNPEFERLYVDHLRKIMLVRGGNRYASKANYNATRLEYLQRMFPDARFIIPIRKPAAHIASLMKQHRLFCEGQQLSPRARDHLRWIGHFEFGLDRRPINGGRSAGHRGYPAALERWGRRQGLEPILGQHLSLSCRPAGRQSGFA